MSGAQQPFDAVALEVLWTRLGSMVDEAAAALVRTSFSSVVRESNDFSCVLTDELGQSLVQASNGTPGFLGTLPKTVAHFLKAYPPAQLAPGDVLITNDPWMGTGHLPDITVAKPIFKDGVLVAFSASTAHSPDIGGKMRSPEPREIFEEGLQIPIMKLLDAGTPDETLFRILRRNVRAPDLTVGDLWAQLTALDLMERRLLELMAEYGLDTLTRLAAEIHGRSERAMRAAIAELPDGSWQGTMETDGVDAPLTLALKLTVRGDSILLDFAGSSPQVERAINVPLCYGASYTAYGVKCVVAPHVPTNAGVLRPLTIDAPEGSILNPRYPASVGARSITAHFMPALLLSVFSQVAPERIMAVPGSPLWAITQAGVEEGGKTFANVFFFNGGMGGNMRRDGVSCLSWPSNISSTPTEVIEQCSPLHVRHRRLRPGSGGEGRQRGGLGQEILFENRSTLPAAVTFLAERTRVAAAGIAGGGQGAMGEVCINGKPVAPKEQHIVHKGDTILLSTPGGGGYGDPRARDPQATAHDRAMGYGADHQEQGSEGI
ncbi:MAG: hydantoinase B/oxoprolinase family protein [SAR324 cluster bacterium]|nr:hydantoinase B/oxoprolinase family protein [SAR324 cluster bacterium]